ncbi:hypothetical protein CDD80_3454 [Ophiocordyceps camponoti-rufipedis]|uniref:Uncharacterized protein n=1 Tax=Ophiocordyceps camponoti-rufipedis TaxID=2004952 RepID=A0A2C5XIT3_9HYPO|nr:hypothetical protein CDD80_3454 [Ophiocordyceps camponoti-rufipedis]
MTPIHDEEAYDLSLLQAATPFARNDYNHAAFDVTSALGPLAAPDADFIRKLQAHEASGTLTGGLGRGFSTDRVRVRGADLLSASSSSASSRRHRLPSLRRPTIGAAGQEEANRSGRIVEVIAEEDIGSLEGGRDARFHSRRSLPPSRVFYPQPDWRPVSMRLPYLSFLIIISIALAVASEMLYRFHHTGQHPLVRFTSARRLRKIVYLAMRFAPSLCAVSYAVAWQFLDLDVRRLEAFHQLSRRGGAAAVSSVNVDYMTGYTLLRPLSALRRRHYAVALSSLAANLAASLVPTLAVASLVLDPSWATRIKDPDVEKKLLIDGTWSRLLTSTLAVCAVAGLLLLWLLQSRQSGLQADAQGIAGLASMAVVSHMLMDFKDLDTATHRDIHHRLRRKRYVLRNSSLAPLDDDETWSGYYDDQGEDELDTKPPPESPHPLILRPAGWLPFLVGSAVFMTLIPVMLFTRANVVVDHVPWIITAGAVAVKLSWYAMETAVRVMGPFYILSRRHAPAKTLLLDYTVQPFGWLPIRALLNGHFLVFAVGLGSVLSELLTILVSGLAMADGMNLTGRSPPSGLAGLRLDAGQETATSFLVNLLLSELILAYIFIVGALVFARRSQPFLPRQPNTLASVLAYMHQSKMLYDFVGTETMSGNERERRLAGTGKSYGLGWFRGRDGLTHCGVDEEELTGRYRHGVDGSQQDQPWRTAWDVF